MMHALKIITLYLVLVCVSTVVMCLTLGADVFAALGTACVGCVLKTIAAWGHGEVFSRIVPGRNHEKDRTRHQ